VHAHLSVVSPFTTAVARAADGAGIPIVGTVHSMWASRRTVVRVVRTVAGWDGSGITWTAVSRVAAAEVRDVLGPRTDVHVVPNAVDVEWWRAGSRTQRRAPAVILVSVMRLAGRKRPHALLEIVDAVRTALPDGPDIRLLVIGDGPLAHQLQGEVGRRGLGGTVTLLGRLTREEIRAVYGATDVFVSAARQESFGIAALEARAAGLPVVAMRAGGIGEFIEPGVGGLLCDDDAAMAEALTALVSDHRARTAIADHNLTHPPVESWSHTIDAFDDVYDRARHRAGLREGSSLPDRGSPGLA
jgi:glycosyltransferase involved in cell wall biosynthesis